MTGTPPASPAQLAYEGYAASTGGPTFDDPMPTWEELPGRIQDAWAAAVRSAVKAIGAEVQPHITEVIRHGNRMTGAALVQHQHVVVEGRAAIDHHCQEIVRLLEPT